MNDLVSKSFVELSQAYEEIKIVDTVSAFYEEIRISDSLSATATEIGKAYDEMDVSKSLGNIYEGIVSVFPSFFGRQPPPPR